MMNLYRLLCTGSALALTGLLGGCAASAPRLYVESAPSAPACESVAWFLPGDQPESLTDQRMRAEVLQVLEAKGYPVASAEPDCLVAYRLVSSTRYRSGPSIGIGMGGSSGRVGGGVGVNVPVGESSRVSGTLFIEVIDARRNAEIWSGRLEEAVRSAEPSAAELGAAVRRILAEFPDRGDSKEAG